MTDAKHILTSKTFWFNVGTALVTVGTELMPLVDIMSPETAGQARAVIITASVVGNIILRTVTNTPVRVK